MQATRLEVSAAAGPYPVLIGPGLLQQLSTLLEANRLTHRRFVASNPLVWQLHGESLARSTRLEPPVLVPDGERFKTLTSVARLYEALAAASADRSSALLAFGGGVIGDMAGYAAATFLRGLPLVHIPTTLLAQVDSAIGGKVGVNLAAGKNLVGAFYPPRLVLVDPTLLATLPRRELRAGLYEVIKYGLIASPTLFAQVREHLTAIFNRDPAILADIVAQSCRIKAEVVSADERESGLRRVLNFGHTVGHALEAATRYRRFRHGEAVAYGMVAALSLGHARGLTDEDTVSALRDLLAKLGPLPPTADISSREVLAAILRDKKVVAGTLHYVAVTQMGHTRVLTDVTMKELRRALAAIGIRR